MHYKFRGGVGGGSIRERVLLRTELDASYFILYGIERDDAEYILSTFTNTGKLPVDQTWTPDDGWLRGGVGETTLAAYDRLKALT